MNYRKIYSSLVKKRLKFPANLQYDYTEKHHIIPRSIAPDKAKDKNNIVILSAKQHFIAHALLVKITKESYNKTNYYKMLCALTAMTQFAHNSPLGENLRYKSNSKLYQHWKIQLSNYIKESGCNRGENSKSYGKKSYYNIKTNEQQFFSDNDKIPQDYVLGIPDSAKSTLNSTLVYNVKTNKQKYIKNQILQQFLLENKDYKIGSAPTVNFNFKLNNPSTGKRWISNIELKQTILIFKDQNLPEGWLEGRITDFKKYLQKYKDAMSDKLYWHFADYQKDIQNKIVPRIYKNKPRKSKEENKRRQIYFLDKFDTREEKIQILKEYLNEYKLNGYKGVVEKFNYKYSRMALYYEFLQYIPDEYNLIKKR